MSNTHFQEKEMSLKAKGLLSLMLSLPDGWDYSIKGLCSLSKDGYESVMNGLKELESFGYLKRTRSFNEKGHFAGYIYDIFETPYTGKPITEKPITGKPITGKPITGNPTQLNTNILNTNILSTNILSTKAKPRKKPTEPGFDLDEFFEAACLRGKESEDSADGETPIAEESV